jgi:hypothetical protein
MLVEKDMGTWEDKELGQVGDWIELAQYILWFNDWILYKRQ